MSDRVAHWIKANHQERMPPRMVAFDTEARSTYENDSEVQEWRVGCAIRWRNDTKVSDHAEAKVFDNPREFWEWVSDFTRNGTRTVVWAHNLGYDVRISRMFEELPKLGFHLEWCNLDRNISSATWRSDHGTIVLADTWTWVPLPLEQIAPQVGSVKFTMPPGRASDDAWAKYCMRDTEILYHAVKVLMDFVSSEGLGNWQPTGAGMAYATWRHKFLTHKVLVNDDPDAIAAERAAMHTGRAEAWRHGKISGGKWTEIDLRNAYVSIAAVTSLPRKLHMHVGSLSARQYRDLASRFAVLSRITVSTDVPCLPYHADNRHLWPVGTFDTWVWDVELDLALAAGANVKIHEAYVYVKAPVLAEWAQWVLEVMADDSGRYHPLARTHVKHCGRALIGRIALRTPSWEYWGANPEGWVGISHTVFPEENRTARMLHVGNDTLIETARKEGKDSLPMMTGYIMATCRAWLWEAMEHVGSDHLAHCDTDSLLCDSVGLSRLAVAYGAEFHTRWAVKGTWTNLEVFGPRAYYRGKERITSGIPRKAEEVAPGEFTGERWSAVASDLAAARTGSVTIAAGHWSLRKTDPRRADAAGGSGRTRAYDAAELV